MLIRGVALTPALAAWLRAAHDDGGEPLFVHGRQGAKTGAHYLTVLRSDGSPLSLTEEREVRALLAAHAAEPLGMPRAR